MLEKKLALVSGGTGGIGTAICQKLAQNYQVVAIYYKNQDHDQAKIWQDQQSEFGYDVDIRFADLRSYDDCGRLMEIIIADYGRVDILVNNAGVTADASLKKMQPEQWHAVMDGNLHSIFNLTKQALPYLLNQGWGRIISIASVNGRKGQFGQCNYAASKSAIYGFTKSLAQEVAKKGITVNCISPGYIETPMLSHLDPTILNQIVDEIPIGRLGQPAEVAAVVDFLASTDCGFVTGANIDINGGQYFG